MLENVEWPLDLDDDALAEAEDDMEGEEVERLCSSLEKSLINAQMVAARLRELVREL